MIIEAGTDLLELGLRTFRWDGDSRTLCVILVTGDLRYLHTQVITDTYDGNLNGVGEAILEAVDVDFVRYFAIVEQCARLVRPEYGYGGHADGVLSHSDILTAAVKRRGLRMLGHLCVGPEYWCSSGPMYEFEDYLMSADVPSIRITRPDKYLETRLAGGAIYGPSVRGELENEPDNEMENAVESREAADS